MNYIRITKENIDKEHICCAMSGKQSVAKKEWLRQRFDDGLVFYRSEERGKCFIEYIPAENAWVPIEADGYLYIDCLWVSGSMKGHGYSNDLLEACIRDAKAQGKKGICILCAEGRKREFLADPKFLAYKGFRVADISDCGINLMYLSIEPTAQMPKFRECAKHPAIEDNGFVLYYTDQCPYTYYWVPRVQEVAKEHGIPFKAIHMRSYMIHGHIHNDTRADFWPLIASRDNVLNAGVDINGFQPVTFDELLENNRRFKENSLTESST